MSAPLSTTMNICVIFVLLHAVSSLPHFFRGRPKHGMLGAPKLPRGSILPPDMWIKQKLTHFNDADTRTWQQVSSAHKEKYCDMCRHSERCIILLLRSLQKMLTQS